MSNPSKAKGTKAETMVVWVLQKSGFVHAERRALSGNTDRGDIAGLPGVVIEVKNCATMALGEWLNEAEWEARNAHAPIWMVWHKRRGKANPLDWYVTMPGSVAVRLLAEHTENGAA